MAEAFEPGGSGAPPDGAKEPTAGSIMETNENQRKRNRSTEGEDPISPEIAKQLQEERKKTKSHETETSTLNVIDALIKPLEETCVSCTKGDSSVEMIKCQTCEDFYHLKCLGVTTNKYEAVLDTVKLLGWSCKECRVDNRKMMMKMKEELASMQQQLDALLARSLATTDRTEWPTPDQAPADDHAKPNIPVAENKTLSSMTEISYADVVQVIGRAVSDCERRKRNIVISGISESNSFEDIDVVSDLLSSVLHMDVREKVTMMKRIGKIDPKTELQSRRILVVLDKESTASEILSRTHLLRETYDPQTKARVYINRDLTPEESKLAYERRQQRQQQQQDNSSARTDSEPQRSKVYYRSTTHYATTYNSSWQPRANQPNARQEHHGGWTRGESTWWRPRRGEGGGGQGAPGEGGSGGVREEGGREGEANQANSAQGQVPAQNETSGGGDPVVIT